VSWIRARGPPANISFLSKGKITQETGAYQPRVYQLETAMGSAIACFAGAQAITVPRSRFLPVKKNNDLLLLWSDVYQIDAASHLTLHPARATQGLDGAPLVFLDDCYYQMIDDMWERFPYGAPSLLACTELRVEGNVYFGRNVTIAGKVHIVNDSDQPLWIKDGAYLTDQVVQSE